MSREQWAQYDQKRLDKGFKILADQLSKVNDFTKKTGIQVEYQPGFGLSFIVPVKH